MNKTEMAKKIGIDTKTIYNWEKKRPELYKIVADHFKEEKEDIKKTPCLDNPQYIKQEIINQIDKLPENKIRMFYHLIMAEIEKYNLKG